MGPLELEIHELEQRIKVEKSELSLLQTEWLKRQDDLVKLSNQRDHILHQSDLLRKGCLLKSIQF